ncbi:MAG: potassium transporter TrkG, partial [Candidatus Eiseniibacteriota bacterium]
MNIRVIARFLGVVVLAVGAAMLCAVPWGIYFHETVGIRALLVSSAVAAAIGGALHLFGRTGPADLYRKESLAVVALGWLFATAVGALPYLLSGTLTSVIDATFEAMSGFTTTGSTVLTAIEAAPRSILFWRDFTHWLGGMGIVVLFIAILPTLGVGGRHLFFSEIPGAVKEDISPRIKSTASMLWKVYVGLSVIEMAALRAAGMSFYDAQCHTFGTMATGGFSTRAASIGAYDSLPIELIVIVFMVLAGTNFSLHVALVRGAPRRLVGD